MVFGHAQFALAEDELNVWMEYDRSSFHAGTYIANFDTTVRLSSSVGGSGTEVNVEDDFGLDDSGTSVWLHIDRRLAPKHRIDFAYYDLSRDGLADIERDIEFGDISFPIGATVATNFDYRIAKLTYSYSFLQNNDLDLAIATGIYTADFDLEARNLDNDEVEGEADTFPVPLIGMRAAYMINPRTILNGYVEYLSISTSDGEATYLDTTASLEYRFGENLGAGLAYNFVSIDGEDKDSDDEGDFEYRGVLLFLLYNFR